jgi:peptide-methionine (S)-S-oxide reductase
MMKRQTLLAMTAFLALPFALAPWVARPASAAPAAIVAPVFAAHHATAVLAGGCFWGLEDVFAKLRGVDDVTVGYSGGARETANYETVSSGRTGHAESVMIAYDPTKISYARLLDVFFSVAHDPTEIDRQGPDDGTQYRSEIFYANDAQKREAEAAIAALTARKAFSRPIATRVAPLAAFYVAEAYHQHFAEKNPTYPYIVAVDAPKVAVLEARFPALLRPGAK